MIEIDDKIVSTDLLRECFACDLGACKGICCVEGNAGAPLETDEVDTLEEEYPNYKPYMTPEGIRAVEAQGFMVVDEDGDYTTPLVDDAECAYAYTEEGITFCAVASAKSSTKRSKLRNNCSRINRETTTRNEKPTYHRCRLAAAHHDDSGTGPPYGDDPRHR